LSDSHRRLQELLYALHARFPDVEVVDPDAEGKFIDEIDKVLAQAPKLVHHVVLENWTHAAKVLRFFKKRSQAGFCIELEEEHALKKGEPYQYRVKIYKV
jgi:hypothetical protein